MALLDSHSYFLPIKGNKILNLKTLDLRERTKTDYFTYEIDCSLLPENETPNADLFFSQVMCEDKEKINHFQKCLGYTITGEIGQKCFFVMIGPSGDNAKSTIMQQIKGIFGKHFTAVQKDILFSLGDKKKQKDLSVYIAELHGKRVGVYNEPSDGMEMNEADIKAITGYDEITAKKLYRDPFTFTPIIKIWIMTNKYFKFDNTSEPMKRRCKIFNMDAQFSNNHAKLGVGKYKKDEQFVENLRTKYRDEVFSWIVRGSYKYFKDGHLNPPAVSVKEMEKYVEMIDPISLFTTSRCVKGDKLRVNRTELFNDYIDWCKEKEEKMMNRENFYIKIATLKYIPIIIHGTKFFRGLDLKSNQKQPDEESEEESDDDMSPSKEGSQPSMKCMLAHDLHANDPYDFGVDKKELSIKPAKQEKVVHKKCKEFKKNICVPESDEDEIDQGDSDEDFGEDHGENLKIVF